jgi:hypothetical protein
MSGQIKDGGPAFPRPIGEYKEVGAGSWSSAQTGMSLRDYFAAHVMTGWLAGLPAEATVLDESVARRAYLIADAMLAARSAS